MKLSKLALTAGLLLSSQSVFSMSCAAEYTNFQNAEAAAAAAYSLAQSTGSSADYAAYQQANRVAISAGNLYALCVSQQGGPIEG